jgi:hypothetical protein
LRTVDDLIVVEVIGYLGGELTIDLVATVIVVVVVLGIILIICLL